MFMMGVLTAAAIGIFFLYMIAELFGMFERRATQAEKDADAQGGCCGCLLICVLIYWGWKSLIG